MQLSQKGLASLTLSLLKPRAAGQHHVIAVLVELNDFRFKGLADIRQQITDATHFNQGSWQEAPKPDVDNETTLDYFNHEAFNDAVLFFDLFDRAPGALVLGALLGQNQSTFFIFLLQDEGFNVVSHGNDLAGINVMFDGKFTGGNNSLCLVADIKKNFVAVNFYDDTFDDVTVIKVLDSQIDGGEEILSRADVIDGNLGTCCY